MTEAYSEQPPEVYFEGLDDVKTLDDLNQLAQLYEFQINSMAADPDGAQEMSEHDLHQQIRACVGILDRFALSLGVYHEAIEITGVGHVGGSAFGPADESDTAYEVFKGKYLGFSVRQEGAVQENDLARYEIGHIVEVGTVHIKGFLRDRTDDLRAFIPAISAELIETPDMRRQRLVQKIVAEMDEEEVISQDIDLILYSEGDQFDLRSLGLLFEHFDVGKLPVHKQDNYISYINLQTELEGRHVTIVAPWALKPALPEGELIPVKGDIYGAIRGFCLNPGINFEATDGPETIGQPHLYLAIEATRKDLTTLFLVPASQIEAYELEDFAV